MNPCSTEPTLPLRQRRERALNDLSVIIKDVWGPRCSRSEGGCSACLAWSIFDCMERLTDSSELDALDFLTEISEPDEEPSP